MNTSRRPNILFLFSDEHDPRHMGVSGSPLVKTPHLDQLAARGTRFTRASTPSPICVPARASLATGAPVHEIRYWDNAIAYDGRVRGWGHVLTDAGHRVESIGKLHYTSTDDPTGFSAQHIPMHIWEGIGQLWGSVRDPLPERKGGFMLKEIGAGLSSYNQYDLDVTDTARQWLHDRAAQPEDKPWVLMVGLVAPHFPLVVPQAYLDRYPLEQIPDSKLLPENGHAHHPWIAAKNRFKCDEDRFEGEPELRRLAIASYYGLCTFLDDNIGRILGTLDETGLSSETLIIYTSDHGDNLGARALWGKSNMYRESVDVPMIVAGPDIPRGAVNHSPVSLTDIHATILDGVGIDASSDPIADDGVYRDSQSMLSMLNTPAPGRTCMSQYHAVGADNGAFMVTDGHMKYHAYVGYAPELYDLDTDPEEAVNLALDAARRDECAAWHNKLETHLGDRTIESVDRLAKDDQAALIERFGGREAALAVGGTPGATPVPGGKHE